MYFESHAHYNDKTFQEDKDVLLKDLFANHTSHIINIGASMHSSETSLNLSLNYKNMFTTVGVHPHSVDLMTEKDILLLEKYCENNKVVAIGEIGLDYYYDYSPRDKQIYWFKKQLELAEKTNLPVVIHSRDASAETFDIIKGSNVRKGVIHCYSGSLEMAKEYIELGFYIGIGGVITFKNAKTLVEVVENISINSILIETDAPYLTPEPFRGQRNDSSNLKYIAEKIAVIKNIPLEEIIKITTQNGLQLFKCI